MNQTEFPNTDKAQEKVTFYTAPTVSMRYTLQVQTERKGFDGEVPFIVPARLIEFKDGRYSTEDEKVIKQIRESKPFRRGKIREITEPEKVAIREAQAQQQSTIRGPITSATIKKEGGLEEKPAMARLKSKGITMCDQCDYVATDDFAGRKVRMHKISAHRTSMKEEKTKK